jgi:glycosyltransferase involved in cell wall biosynthesis
VFVLPSHVENFPITVLEAMSAGRAVVASRVGGVPDQIEDGVGGLLVPPRDPGALAAALGQLAHDRALRERMGALNARRARERYDSPVVFGRLSALYDRLLGTDRPDARPAWSAEGEVR